MIALPWAAIFLAAAAVWFRPLRGLALGLLVLGYAAALAEGLLGVEAAGPILLLLAAAAAVSQTRNRLLCYAGHVLFIALALALSLHVLPGFHNPRVIDAERFTPDAVPFTLYLNLDKPLAGFWLLLVLPWIQPPRGLRAVLTAVPTCLVATAMACLVAAASLGLVVWAPKWPDLLWLWVLNNLLLVCLAEEAVFRGYIQGGLARLLNRQPYGEVVALLVSAILFGLAHAAGGWQWVLVGSIAGIGYGVAYRLGGLRASVLVHFGLNLLHISLFTYPSLQLTV